MSNFVYSNEVQGLDFALSQKKIQGLCLLCFENERPLGLALGYLDWLFSGHFTKLIKTEVLTGKSGQLLYAPVRWNQLNLHFLVVGSGELNTEGQRPAFQETLLEKGLQGLQELNLESMGILKADWNLTGNEKILAAIEKRKVCVLN